MKLIIVRTNIRSDQEVAVIRPLLDTFAGIDRWSLDLEDIDHVLKIRASDQVSEQAIFQLIRSQGFICENLPD